MGETSRHSVTPLIAIFPSLSQPGDVTWSYRMSQNWLFTGNENTLPPVMAKTRLVGWVGGRDMFDGCDITS